MKKIMNKINFAIIAAMTAIPAFAADPINPNSQYLCDLIEELGDVFRILRTFAFIGAAFFIAGWAWDYIAKGEAKMDDIKKKGTGLLVGFVLLFVVGLILNFIIGLGNSNVCGKDMATVFGA